MPKKESKDIHPLHGPQGDNLLPPLEKGAYFVKSVTIRSGTIIRRGMIIEFRVDTGEWYTGVVTHTLKHGKEEFFVIGNTQIPTSRVIGFFDRTKR